MGVGQGWGGGLVGCRVGNKGRDGKEGDEVYRREMENRRIFRY